MPMKLPSTRFPVDVDPLISTPTRLPEITCDPWPFPSTITPVALSISTPASALPRSASPVESVPIRLPITVTLVAVAPEINTPIRLAEITLPGPIMVPGAVSATPAWSLPSTAVPAAVRPMMLLATVLPSRVGAGDVHAVASIRRDHVAVARRGAADLVIGRVVDPDAVGGVAGLAVAEEITAAGRRADVVGLDQIPRRAHALDMHAVSCGCRRDEVARARDGAADDVARRINDARRIGRRSRRLDQHPFRAVAGRESRDRSTMVRPRRSGCPGPGCPSAPGSINTPCMPLPAMTLLSCGSVPPTVALAEPSTTPCCVLPCPISSTVFGAGRAMPVVGSTG